MILVFSYTAGVVLFFVTARYRLPLVPLLLLLASYALYWLFEHRRRLGGTFFAAVGALVLLGIWSNYDSAPMDMEGDAEVFYNLGHAYVETRQLDKGIEALEKAARMAPNDAEILVSLGTAYAFKKAFKAAEKPLKHAARLYPERLDIRLNLANTYFSLKRYREAAAEYGAVLAANPTHLDALRSGARALARSGQVDEAINYYERLYRFKPITLEPLLALGYLYGKNRRPDRSLLYYQRALMLNSNHLIARSSNWIQTTRILPPNSSDFIAASIAPRPDELGLIKHRKPRRGQCFDRCEPSGKVQRRCRYPASHPPVGCAPGCGCPEQRETPRPGGRKARGCF